MKMKILSIKEKVPVATTLRDGFYTGVWGGSIITLQSEGKVYELEAEEGIRGIGIRVIVEVKDCIASFEVVKN